MIIQDPMVETPEYAFELAKIYRDGIIVSKSLAMYKKIYNKLPKQMQVDLEEDR